MVIIAIALVLGEFTFASLLNFNTLQVVINQVSKANAQESVAASLASILFAALLLVGLSFVSGRRRGPSRRGGAAPVMAPQPADLPTDPRPPS